MKLCSKMKSSHLPISIKFFILGVCLVGGKSISSVNGGPQRLERNTASLPSVEEAEASSSRDFNTSQANTEELSLDDREKRMGRLDPPTLFIDDNLFPGAHLFPGSTLPRPSYSVQRDSNAFNTKDNGDGKDKGNTAGSKNPKIKTGIEGNDVKSESTVAENAKESEMIKPTVKEVDGGGTTESKGASTTNPWPVASTTSAQKFMAANLPVKPEGGDVAISPGNPEAYVVYRNGRPFLFVGVLIPL